MKLKVLCIDDSKAVHAFLKECLKDVSSEFKSVYDGEQAVALFKSQGVSDLDVIFLDWEMPKMTGPEVLDHAAELRVKTPIIMLTSKNEIGDITTGLSKGAVEYIMKPFTKDIIIEKLSSVLGRRS